jgi:hypothetical protein
LRSQRGDAYGSQEHNGQHGADGRGESVSVHELSFEPHWLASWQAISRNCSELVPQIAKRYFVGEAPAHATQIKRLT